MKMRMAVACYMGLEILHDLPVDIVQRRGRARQGFAQIFNSGTRRFEPHRALALAFEKINTLIDRLMEGAANLFPVIWIE